MHTIEEIEGKYWGLAPIDSSNLVKKIFNLRKKELSEFNAEDLRIMISQDESLAILIPIAIKVLEEEFYVEGDYYPGDLLKSILTSTKEFWDKNEHLRKEILNLYVKNIDSIEDVGLTDKIRQGIFDAFEKFKQNAQGI